MSGILETLNAVSGYRAFKSSTPMLTLSIYLYVKENIEHRLIRMAALFGLWSGVRLRSPVTVYLVITTLLISVQGPLFSPSLEVQYYSV